MKKLGLIMSLLLIAALGLAACAGNNGTNNTGNNVLGTEPAGETGGFGEGAETEVPDGDTGVLPGTGEEVTPEATEALATEAPEETLEVMATPTAMAGGLDATEEVTGTTGMTDTETTLTGMDRASRLSNWLGMDVQNLEGEQLGEIEDLVIDLGASNIRYALVGVGGFLDIGERFVPVPWQALTLSTEGDEDPVVMLNADQEALETAPNLDTSEIDLTAPDWDAEFNDFWSTQGLSSAGATGTITGTDTITGSGTTTDTTGATGTDVTGSQGRNGIANCGVGAAPGLNNEGVQQGQGQGVAAGQQGCTILATDLMDYDIVFNNAGGVGNGMGATDTMTGTTGMTDTTGVTGTTGVTETTGVADPQAMPADRAGNIEDVIIDPQSGDVLYLVIEADAALEELDGRWILIPLNALNLGVEENTLMLTANQSILMDAPSFEVDNLPATGTEGWDVEIESFWSTNAGAGTGTGTTSTPAP